MKTIAVLLACLACAVAYPQAYGHAAPVKSAGYGGYEAPAVKAVGYGGYEAPAVKAAAYEAPVLKTAAYEAPVLVKAAPVIPIVRYLKEDDNYGTYNLQVEGGDGTLHSEVGSLKNINDPESEGPVNVKTGSYSWTSPEGQTFRVDYVADENGFHAVGDHLPKPVPLPAEHLKALNNYDSYSAPAPPPAPVRAVPAYAVRADPYTRIDFRGNPY